MALGVIVGGTGAQGGAVVRQLSSAGHHLKILSRNPDSPQAKELAQLSNVELIATAAGGHDDESFLTAAKGAHFAWINTDGFSIGESMETYWGIRFYELSVRAQVKHYVYSSLDNLGPETRFDPKFMIGFYNGKARVVEYLKAQPNLPDGTSWSAISSGPYAQMLSETLAPSQSADGTYLFTLPLALGAMPFIHLDDYARYIRWIIENPTKSIGRNLKVATALVTGDDIAKSFTAVTGKPAKHVSIPITQWVEVAFKKEAHGVNTVVGTKLPGDSDAARSAQTFAQMFTAWWTVFTNTKPDNTGLIKRDFEELDQILPDRVKSIREWMEVVGYTGEKQTILKRSTDAVNQAPQR